MSAPNEEATQSSTSQGSLDPGEESLSLSAPFVRRPIATALFAIGLLVLGGVAYVQLPVAALPRVDSSTRIRPPGLPWPSIPLG